MILKLFFKEIGQKNDCFAARYRAISIAINSQSNTAFAYKTSIILLIVQKGAALRYNVRYNVLVFLSFNHTPNQFDRSPIHQGRR